VAVPDGLVSLAVMGAFAATSPPDRRLAVVAGMTGRPLPDIDKPTTLWFRLVALSRSGQPFHTRIQHEAPHRGLRRAARGGNLRLRRARRSARP